LNSPPGRVYELDGQVLLVGVGYDACTTLHVAEHIAGVRYRQPKYATVLENGRPQRYEYGETDHCCEKFALLEHWLGDRQRRGKIGNAEARLFRSRDAVAAALARLRENETVFLHPPGECRECDLALSSSGLRAPPRPPSARAG
jgi:aminoglycoside N3'-acetyltransferase